MAILIIIGVDASGRFGFLGRLGCQQQVEHAERELRTARGEPVDDRCPRTL